MNSDISLDCFASIASATAVLLIGPLLLFSAISCMMTVDSCHVEYFAETFLDDSGMRIAVTNNRDLTMHYSLWTMLALWLVCALVWCYFACKAAWPLSRALWQSVAMSVLSVCVALGALAIAVAEETMVALECNRVPVLYMAARNANALALLWWRPVVTAFICITGWLVLSGVAYARKKHTA